MREKRAFHWTAMVIVLAASFPGCGQKPEDPGLANRPQAEREESVPSDLTAADILGNADYPAICYGGYRGATRDDVPTVDQLKEDMQILSAMGVKLLRTYNTQQFDHAANLLEAIDQLRQEDSDFEMYVMLGAWIDCEGAWTPDPNHEAEDVENNTAEINAAVELANAHPETVKIIAVGNEAMVHWATTYFVRPAVIRKWVDHLQKLKATGELPADIWITSSDNFASWGGEDTSYHTEELTALIQSVDYVSLHTYPFHDTHYNSDFWIASEDEPDLWVSVRADAAIQRAKAYAMKQYQDTADYIKSLGIEKPIHVGETGWATTASTLYGADGSQAADEFKERLFYEAMRDWSNNNGMSCFYFEAFDEQWKDANDADGSENHFGLINLQGQAKYALWDQVDAGVFEGLTRGGVPITKTFGGDEDALLASVLRVPSRSDLGSNAIPTTNPQRTVGDEVTEDTYVLTHQSMTPDPSNDMTYPSEPVKLNAWEGTCGIELSGEGVIHVATGTGEWWGCGLETQGEGKGENLSQFASGHIHFEIKGDANAPFTLGIQSGLFDAGTQVNSYATFGPDQKYQLGDQWASHSIPLSELSDSNDPKKRADLSDVTSLLFLRGEGETEGKNIAIRNVYFSQR